jgi:nicotinamidase-related amidase
MAQDTILIDIDTQWDFVIPTGGWPVPGAFKAIACFERLVRYARAHHLPILATVQALSDADARFEKNGGNLPVHCVKGTPGHAKVPATRSVDAAIVQNRAYPGGEVPSWAGRREIVLETSGPDILSNPNATGLLAGFKKAVVFGVSAEDAVMNGVRALLKQGIAVEVVQNGVAARDEDPESLEKYLSEMTALGAKKIRDMDVMTRYTTARHGR